MLIRKAQKKDIPSIVKIWSDFMKYLQNANKDYYRVKNGDNSFSDFLHDVVEYDKDKRVFIAEQNGNIAGFILIAIEHLPEWFGNEKIGLIRYLAIKEGERERGLGKKLVLFATDWFISMNIRRIELYVLKGIIASSFWKHLGYRVLMDRRFIELNG